MDNDDTLGQDPTLTNDNHRSPATGSVVLTPRTGVNSVNDISEDERDGGMANSFATRVAESALDELLGIPLDALELRGRVITLTTAYLQKVVEIVKKDPYGGTAFLHHTPDDDNDDMTPAPADPETSSSQDQGREGRVRGSSPRSNSRSQSDKRQRRRPNDDEEDEDVDEKGRKGKRRAGPRGGSREVAGTVWYSCPFRKLDPITFNVRDHVKCANNALEGMSNLKSVSCSPLRRDDADTRQLEST